MSASRPSLISGVSQTGAGKFVTGPNLGTRAGFGVPQSGTVLTGSYFESGATSAIGNYTRIGIDCNATHSYAYLQYGDNQTPVYDQYTILNQGYADTRYHRLIFTLNEIQPQGNLVYLNTMDMDAVNAVELLTNTFELRCDLLMAPGKYTLRIAQINGGKFTISAADIIPYDGYNQADYDNKTAVILEFLSDGTLFYLTNAKGY